MLILEVFAVYQTSISSAETDAALQYIIEAFMRAEYTAVLLNTADSTNLLVRAC
jgi:hypothetical protein